MPAPSLMPEPRSYWGTAIQVGAMSALPFAVLWAWLFAAMTRNSFGEILPFGLVAGILFGVSFGLVMAIFLQGTTTTVDIGERDAFVGDLNVALSQIGYFPERQVGDFFTFKPSFQAGLAAGRISVQVRERQAVIVGPKMYVGKLLRRLSAEV